MYMLEEKEDCSIYRFDWMELTIIVVENDSLKNVYIRYRGYNPLFTMLLGGFTSYCEMSQIQFDVAKTDDDKNSTMYCIIKEEYLDKFLNEIRYFISENHIERMLNEQDRNDWKFYK